MAEQESPEVRSVLEEWNTCLDIRKDNVLSQFYEHVLEKLDLNLYTSKAHVHRDLKIAKEIGSKLDTQYRNFEIGCHEFELEVIREEQRLFKIQYCMWEILNYDKDIAHDQKDWMKKKLVRKDEASFAYLFSYLGSREILFTFMLKEKGIIKVGKSETEKGESEPFSAENYKLIEEDENDKYMFIQKMIDGCMSLDQKIEVLRNQQGELLKLYAWDAQFPFQTHNLRIKRIIQYLEKKLEDLERKEISSGRARGRGRGKANNVDAPSTTGPSAQSSSQPIGRGLGTGGKGRGATQPPARARGVVPPSTGVGGAARAAAAANFHNIITGFKAHGMRESARPASQAFNPSIWRP